MNKGDLTMNTLCCWALGLLLAATSFAQQLTLHGKTPPMKAIVIVNQVRPPAAEADVPEEILPHAATAQIAGIVQALSPKADGGCIVELVVSPPDDLPERHLDVWIPGGLAPGGTWCPTIDAGDYLAVLAALWSYPCGPDYCSAPQVRLVQRHRKAVVTP